MIQLSGLTKRFGPFTAVDGVSFSVERGEVLGFLGPNGAGKSTTMRMITGFYPPDSGTIKVGNHDVLEDPIAAKRLIGYLPENAPSYSDMTVRGFLGFAAEVRGLRGAAKRGAVARVVEMCFLDSVVNQSVDTLSKGYKHRTCLAQSLLHDRFGGGQLRLGVDTSHFVLRHFQCDRAQAHGACDRHRVGQIEFAFAVFAADPAQNRQSGRSGKCHQTAITQRNRAFALTGVGVLDDTKQF